jgi:hypothetical protein
MSFGTAMTLNADCSDMVITHEEMALVIDVNGSQSVRTGLSRTTITLNGRELIQFGSIEANSTERWNSRTA